MSLTPYSYRPATPPEVTAVDQLNNSAHSRNTSGSSYYTNDTSPDSVTSHITTPSRSPLLRQHGPTLLPKIRPQDSVLDPSSAGGPKRTHRRVLSTTRNPPGFAPYSTSRPPMQRSVTEPVECTTLISPISTSSFVFPRASSVLDPPVTLIVPRIRKPSHAHSHSRAGSVSSVDDSMLSRYGYPTYRRLPIYVSQASEPQADTIMAPEYVPYQAPVQIIEPSTYLPPELFDMPMDFGYTSRQPSLTPPPSVTPTVNSSLLTYLTCPTQPVNLVRHLTISPSRGLHNYFWWDIRNVRRWTSFSLAAISSIPGLMDLLTYSIDISSFPSGPSPTSTATPASELDLASLCSKIYFPRVNAAVQLSQGATSLSLYCAPSPDRSTGSPHFLANYPHDADRTLGGLPRGRVVGLVKSFNHWNTGMRRESPARKVDYLNGLSHLQKCMRDHSCRYGFIVTEIELVCVRAGCDEKGQPYFGYLELSEAIATKTAAPVSSPSNADGEFGGMSPLAEPHDAPLTVSLALYYLVMLAKSTPLPGQPGSFMDVGGPGALTRQRVWHGLDLPEEEWGKDGRDKWIPEPQVSEKRDAKRSRGWILPGDPWHKREAVGVLSAKKSMR